MNILTKPANAIARGAMRMAMKYGGVPVSYLRAWMPGGEEGRYGKYSQPFARDVDIFRGITIIAESCAAVPLMIGKTTNGKKTPVDSGPEWETLHHPNRRMSTRDLIHQIVGYLQLERGEAMVVILREGSARQLITVNPEWVRIDIANDGTYTYEMMGADGKERRFLENEVIHFIRCFNPYEPGRGLGPLAAARLSFEEEMDIRAHNQALVKNGGIKPLIMSTEQPLPEESELKRVQARVNAARKDIKARGEIMFMGYGLKWQDVAMSPQDMDFAAQRLATKTDKAVALGIPPSKLGDYQRDQADAEVQERDFWNDTCSPILQLIASTLERDMWKIEGRAVPGTGDNWAVWFDLDAVPALVMQRQRIQEADYKDLEAGLTTINRVLEKRGEDPVPWGDVWWPAGMRIPIDGPEAPILAQPDTGADGAGDDEDAAAITPPRVTSIGNDLRWLSFTTEGALLENQFNRQLSNVWEWVAAETIRNIRTASRSLVPAGGANSGIVGLVRVKASGADFVVDLADIVQRVRSETTPVVRAAQASGARRGLRLAKKPASNLRLDAAPAIERLSRQVQRFAQPVSETTWRKLVAALSDVLAEGGNDRDLIDAVRSVMDVRVNEATRTGRTETSAAMNGGVELGFKQSGVVLTKSWLTAGDEHVRDAHEHANGQEVPIGETFAVGGERLLYPGDPSASAGNVIECRCTLMPGKLAA